MANLFTREAGFALTLTMSGARLDNLQNAAEITLKRLINNFILQPILELAGTTLPQLSFPTVLLNRNNLSLHEDVLFEKYL